MLTERRAQLLGLIVDDYINTAVPVGSEAIVRKFGLSVSPATIRNEMARLEEEGYITHPHTSAGRMPTDKGYRYYVEVLMPDHDLSADEQRRIRHQFYQIRQELEEWLDLAATVLAQAAQSAAVVTSPWAPDKARLKQIQLVSLQETVALLVVVLEGAKVCQQIVVFTELLSQDDLTALARQLNRLFSGLDAEQIRAQPVELTTKERIVLEATLRILDEESQADIEEAHLKGIQNVLAQPEFAQAEKILQLLEVLDERTLPRLIPFRSLVDESITILIGSENSQEAMRECSMVLARYGLGQELVGALAVVGPTRMRYARAVPAVRFMASVMSDLLAAYYSGGEAGYQP